MRVRANKSAGFTILEVIIVFALIAAAAVVFLLQSARGLESQRAQNSATALSKIVPAVRTRFNAAGGSYEGLTAALLVSLQDLPRPFTWNGAAISDAWGNQIHVSGNAAGAVPSFVITVGGAAPMSAAACVQLATAFEAVAASIRVGEDTNALTPANGRLGLGGSRYTEPGLNRDTGGMLLACSRDHPVVGLEFR